MLLLALDTCNRILSVALCTEKVVLATTKKEMDRGQGEALIPLIQELLAQTKRNVDDITAIAVAIGPGSFTGVRIGLATAKAFGMALNIPVWGVTNFEAEACNTKGALTVVLDSKRGDYFVQHFSDGIPTDEAHIETLDELKKALPFTATGDAARELKEAIDCAVLEQKDPSAVAIAQIAQKRTDHPLPPEPLYLRGADVTL